MRQLCLSGGLNASFLPPGGIVAQRGVCAWDTPLLLSSRRARVTLGLPPGLLPDASRRRHGLVRISTRGRCSSRRTDGAFEPDLAAIWAMRPGGLMLFFSRRCRSKSLVDEKKKGFSKKKFGRALAA